MIEDVDEAKQQAVIYDMVQFRGATYLLQDLGTGPQLNITTIVEEGFISVLVFGCISSGFV